MLQDLCKAALKFSFDTLKPGGHFICKFYQGNEDQEFETRLKSLFQRVHREKPDSSRKVPILPRALSQRELKLKLSKESKEVYFIGLRRKTDAPESAVMF